MIVHPQGPFSILVVEADPQFRETLLQTIAAWGFDAHHADDLATAVPATLRWGPFHAIICGENLPDGSGTFFLRWLREQVITVPFVLVADCDVSDVQSNSRVGVLMRPLDMAQLKTMLERLLPGAIPHAHRDGADGAFSSDGAIFPKRERQVRGMRDGEEPAGKASDRGLSSEPDAFDRGSRC